MYTHFQKEELGVRSAGVLNSFTHKVESNQRKQKLQILNTSTFSHPFPPKPIHKNKYLISFSKKDKSLLSSMRARSRIENHTLSIIAFPLF